MKKLAIAGALMLLAGCAEVENYNNVVKTPAPDWLRATGRPKGRNVRWSVRKR
ncbi:putative lipoprotein [Escherichia coli]|nr:putative lipoprotein [Escherichia coli]